MRKIVAILIVTIFTTPIFGQSIYGNAKNASKDVTLSLRNIHKRTIKKIPIQETKFNTGDLGGLDGYFLLIKNSNSTYIYLKPEFNLEVNFDAKDFNKTVSFSGKGAKVNNYLLAKKKLLKERWKDTESFYNSGEKNFLSKVRAIHKELQSLVSQLDDEDFKKHELENLKYNYLNDIFYYPHAVKYRTGTEPKLSSDVTSELKDVFYDDATLYSIYPSYRNLASSKWKKELKKATSFKEMEASFRKIKTNQIFVDVIVDALYRISDTPEKSKFYYELIRKYVPNQEFVSKARKKYNKVKSTAIGKKAPGFTFEDKDGNKVSLKDFKGKYVFIDIWATWCTPCLKEVPHLKKLATQYQDKNIVFVGISVDEKTEYDLWKKMLNEKELNGVQLFADNAFDSEFVSDFGVSSIPRLILISPEGKIVESHLSKPSQEKTKQLLNKLLK
ncbi:TlpA family protein disulfide reductase [Tenacibaculum jejuense]|uniref:Thioredoxin family protein n=1 Tax=Tenacibaculum jejuense TaxID=584609 RepID=A0A238U660_9FLAO|nr:TlpA disulfide reductase family protein [Tenacibaculum jejuense]SNR13840.1 Thioredoxin family protein [Tenacibaculum jejuense]